MPYQQNIPQPTDVKAQSQADILGNFQALVTWGNGYGEFALQGAVPTFSAGNDGIYTLNNATTAKNELYVHKQTQAGTIDIPFTASKMSNTAPSGCVNGWTYLPSGLLIKWGSVAANNSVVSISVTAISGGPNFTQLFQAFVTPKATNASGNFYCGQLSPLAAGSGNFNAYCQFPDAGNTFINYIVLGI